MEKSRAIELLEHLAWDRDIDRNPYGDALRMAIDALKAQLSSEGTTKGTTSDLISRQAVKYKLTALVNEFEEILAHIREREVNDSVCGMCEYDGAYMGQSGDWCNECPGFDRDDCFKLKDKYREEWLSIDSKDYNVQITHSVFLSALGANSEQYPLSL